MRLDLGYFGSRWARFLVGVDYLSTTIDRVDSLGTRERGSGYVFTAVAEANFMTSLARRVSPYAGVGVGVDAVGTTISNEQIGAIYNTNVFDVHGQHIQNDRYLRWRYAAQPGDLVHRRRHPHFKHREVVTVVLRE